MKSFIIFALSMLFATEITAVAEVDDVCDPPEIKLRMDGGCGKRGKRKLGILTSKISGAKTDDDIYANVFAGGNWVGWEHLENLYCDDFTTGNFDYFGNFKDVTAPWKAISLYNCGDDGLKIEAVSYWNGNNMDRIRRWYARVFGSHPEDCVYDYRGGDGNYAYYGDIEIDGSERFCTGVTFTAATRADIFYGPFPGKPVCGGVSESIPPVMYHMRKDRDVLGYATSDLQERLLNYLMIVTAIAALLFISNSCMITMYIRNKPNGYGSVSYGKVINADVIE